MKNLKLFFPQVTNNEIENLNLIVKHHVDVKTERLTQDWQTLFCDFVGFSEKKLPWTQLRLAQFDISHKVKTACCCDPVLVQLTHRGAYMLGQAPLQLSQNEVLRIVAQINECLMVEGESLFLVDQYSWLFTSEKEIQLNSFAVQDLIGKDLFNYPYVGNDANYWQQRSTEIQMLIKQMIDYQGVSETPLETMMNVHFFDPVNLLQTQEIPFIKNEKMTVVSDNELIRSFCTASMLAHKPLSELSTVTTEHCALIVFDHEREKYAEILDDWLSHANQLNSSMLFCQDAVLSPDKPPSFFKKMFSFN